MVTRDRGVGDNRGTVAETVDRFESSFHEITTKLTGLDEKEKEKLRPNLPLWDLKSKRFVCPERYPLKMNSLKVRERRDLGWRLVLRSWIDNETIVEEAAAFDPNDDLPKAYEKSVVQADDVADRLRREADRVAQNANFIAQQTAIQQDLADIDENRKKFNDQLAETELEWKEHWESAGIKPLSPERDEVLEC